MSLALILLAVPATMLVVLLLVMVLGLKMQGLNDDDY